MFNGSGTNDNNIFTEVISSMEVINHLSIDLPNVINISKNRLAHHMVTIDVEVDILHQSLFRILVYSLQFLPDCIFFHLKMPIV